MKLYAIINGNRYEVGVGSTFSEEYNETLDSGSIIFDQIPRIKDLKPYDDVFIYSELIELPTTIFENEFAPTRSKRGTYIRVKAAKLDNLKSFSYKISRAVHIIGAPSSLTFNFREIVSKTNESYRIKFHCGCPRGATQQQFEQLLAELLVYGIDIHSVTRFGADVYINFNLGTYDNEPVWEGKISPYLGNGVPVAQRLNFDIVKKPQLSEFYKHMLVDDFSEELNNVITTSLARYKYKISLFSETKRLEKVILPNISITQPVDKGIRRSVWEYLNVYLNLYSPQIKVIDDLENSTWKYENKYRLADRVQDKFENVDAPEMSVTNPTLRDIITQLMLVKDCIPVVHDDVIDYLDVSLRNGEFSINPQYVNYVHSSMSSGGYSLEARREYSGALSQDKSAKMTEFLGFRNSNTSILTIENLVLETRFPIYKINKLYMCYYKTAKKFDSATGTLSNEFKFLCKQDITDLVLQNIVRNAMSQNYVQFENDLNNDLIKTPYDLSKYKICTVGYDIGSNRISGWGDKYTFYPINNNLFDGWFTASHTSLENIIRFMDKKFPYGVRGYQFIVDNDISKAAMEVKTDGLSSIVTDGEFGSGIGIVDVDNNSVRQKAVFFEIDYNAMFSGAIVHTKDDVEDDDITTADNCSSSLTVLEADGLFEKEKMNRFANRTYNIQARYEGTDAFNKMESMCNHILGSVYKNEEEGIDDVVIYHREISVYDHFILANFAGTFDYVLKNYFTSVFAKLRTYNLAQYGESVTRSENYREYILLSTNECYYDDDSIMYSYIDTFTSAFKETQKQSGVDSFNLENQINFSYIQYKNEGTDAEINESRSFSDTNVFVAGKIICINIKMYDNATTGVYITNSCLGEIKIENKDGEEVETEQSRGSLQSWHVSLDDVMDPFQKVVIFGFGHLYTGVDNIPSGKQLLIPENNLTNSVQPIYQNQLLKFPNFYNIDYLSQSARFYIATPENKQRIYKDNKEIVDFTFQFEPYSADENVILSPWFSKLNEWNGIYQKWSNTSFKNVMYDKSFLTIGGFMFKVIENNQWDGFLKFTLKYDKDEPNRALQTQSNPNQVTIFYADPENYLNYRHTIPAPGTEQTTTPVCTVKTNIIGTDTTGRYGEIVRFRLVGVKVRPGSDLVGLVFSYDIDHYYEDGSTAEWIRDYIDEVEYNPDPILNVMEVRYEGAGTVRVETVPVRFNASVIDDYDQTTDQNVDESIFGQVYFGTSESTRTLNYYYKNMFAIVSSEPIKKEIVYDTYLSQDSDGTTLSGVKFGDDFPSEMTIINTDDENNEYDQNTYIPFENLFSFARVDNYPKIKVGNSLLSNYPAHKSIQFWYLDNNGNSPEGRLQFVFGVNTEENEKEVFVSAMTRKSPKVYSADHKTVIGEVFNTVESGYYIEQNKIVANRYVGNIYYENVEESSDTGIVIDVSGYLVV